jgi:hypothetical protein
MEWKGLKLITEVGDNIEPKFDGLSYISIPLWRI